MLQFNLFDALCLLLPSHVGVLLLPFTHWDTVYLPTTIQYDSSVITLSLSHLMIHCLLIMLQIDIFAILFLSIHMILSLL